MKLRKYNAKMYLTGFMFIFQPLLTSFRGENRKYSFRGKQKNSFRGEQKIFLQGRIKNIPSGGNRKYSFRGEQKILIQWGIENIPPGGNRKYSSRGKSIYKFGLSVCLSVYAKYYRLDRRTESKRSRLSGITWLHTNYIYRFKYTN